MKGIIAEITGKYAIVLAQNGVFKKVRLKNGMKVGEEIDMNAFYGKADVKLIAKSASIAAAVLLAFSGAVYSYAMPFSYVHVDINPSVELAVNIYDRIIKAEALNDEGKVLLDNSGLNNTKLHTGVSKLLHKAVECGYLKAPAANTETVDENKGTAEETESVAENTILITVSSVNHGKLDKLKKEIVDVASKELLKENINSEIIIGGASIKQRNTAKNLGITPGRLVLLEDAVEKNPGLSIDDFKETSIDKLIESVKSRMQITGKQGSDESGIAPGPREDNEKRNSAYNREGKRTDEADKKKENINAGRHNTGKRNSPGMRQENADSAAISSAGTSRKESSKDSNYRNDSKKGAGNKNSGKADAGNRINENVKGVMAGKGGKSGKSGENVSGGGIAKGVAGGNNTANGRGNKFKTNNTANSNGITSTDNAGSGRQNGAPNVKGTGMADNDGGIKYNNGNISENRSEKNNSIAKSNGEIAGKNAKRRDELKEDKERLKEELMDQIKKLVRPPVQSQ